jgi:hypothetical protein
MLDNFTFISTGVDKLGAMWYNKRHEKIGSKRRA